MFDTILATALKLLAVGNVWWLPNSAARKGLHLQPLSRRYLNKLYVPSRWACGYKGAYGL